MLVEKEIIAPGTYWYVDEATGLPRKLDVTSDLTKYWHDEGSKMLSAGLTIPVPFEHDFSAHPMTPKDKLLNNAGEIKEYRLRDNILFGVIDVQDPDVKRKIGHSIRWTSPWINSFTDGDGRKWNNVISHLALTTRPRVTKQAPFENTTAALSLATQTAVTDGGGIPKEGYCLSKAGKLVLDNQRLRPQFPMAFSMWAGGVKLADDDMMPPKKKEKPKPSSSDDKKPDDKSKSSTGDKSQMNDEEDEDEFGLENEGGEGSEGSKGDDFGGMRNPLRDAGGDVKMEELLCDLLTTLGVMMPENCSESEFKRALYEATMRKIKELTEKGMAAGGANAAASGANTTSPAGNKQPNPLIQQEQQPMYMSLEEINKLPEPMKGVALAMYTENQKLQAKLDANEKVTNSLRDSKLKEAATARTTRINLLSKMSPRVKADLEAMVALPSMALSMGEAGVVIDPMEQTLSVLEKGLADIPRLLTTDSAALTVQPQPSDNELSAEVVEKMAEDLARMMGCPPEKKAG